MTPGLDEMVQAGNRVERVNHRLTDGDLLVVEDIATQLLDGSLTCNDWSLHVAHSGNATAIVDEVIFA